MINYIKADLFTAPHDSVLLHSCNCKGMWGSGVAKQFADKFPQDYEDYHSDCVRTGAKLIGQALVYSKVICLMTSVGYGKYVDSPDKIMINTESAINDLLIHSPQIVDIHLPKINSGLFKVPWEQTESILNKFPQINWQVYSL